MTFLPADEDDASVKMDELDLTRIAILLDQQRPEGNAYDVLRDVLGLLNDEKRGRRAPLH